MKKLSSTRNRRKLIIVFLFVLVFNTIFPKESKAISFDPMFYFGQLIYGAETGILKAINNIFCDDEHDMLETDISPVYLSPETIIKGKFAIFDANIFKDIDESKEYYDVGSDNSIITGKDNLRSIIALVSGYLFSNGNAFYYDIYFKHIFSNYRGYRYKWKRYKFNTKSER